MKSTLILLISIVASNILYAQQKDCKVLKIEISGSYSGECKDGLAHGTGIALGTDKYEGQFKKGKPDGNGTYTWANGNYYDGEWKNGLKTGTGTMVTKDTTLKGIWKSDKYLGEVILPPYKITRSINVSRPSITKSNKPLNEIRIRILQSGTENKGVENMSVVSSSGTTYNTGYTGGFGIKNLYFPVDVKIQYFSWNKVQAVKYEVIFEFTINESGLWEVTINN